MRPQTMRLEGLERQIVFNRLRAALGERWEMPRLLDGLDIADGGRWLEIGAGTGWGTSGVARRLRPAQVIATDYDAAILPQTRASFERQRIADRIAFAQADAKHLPFQANAFDGVLGLYVLHHVMGYREALAEISRVTRPGGWFILVDPVRPVSLPHFVARIWPAWLATAAELTRMLHEAGFEVTRWAGLPTMPRVIARKAA